MVQNPTYTRARTEFLDPPTAVGGMVSDPTYTRARNEFLNPTNGSLVGCSIQPTHEARTGS